MIKHWFVIKTRPKQESRAIENLSRLGFHTYCPWFLSKKKHKAALFPGYIFLLCCNSAMYMYGKIRSTRGVRGFIRFGDKIATLPDEVISTIKSQAIVLEKEPLFHEGQTVEFAEGPFAQYQGIYLCKRGNDRSIVLLQLLNSHRKIEVCTSCLKSA